MTRTIRIALTCLSCALVAGPVAYMIGMFMWARRLDTDYSGSYACCTQQAMAAFHAHFWSGFYVAAGIALAGCIGLGATIASKAALRIGFWTLVAGVGLLFCSFAFVGLHDWTGAVVFTVTLVVFCAAAALGLTGGMRVGWSKLRQRNESLS